MERTAITLIISKGIWVDNQYILLTGNNLNPRAWRLDAENGLLIHDPKQELLSPAEKELSHIRQHTKVLQDYSELEELRNILNRCKNC